MHKQHISLVLAIFTLSIFTGVILSVVVRLWVIGNIGFIKQIQTKEEARQLNKLFESYASIRKNK